MVDSVKIVEQFLSAENTRAWNLWQSFLHSDIKYEVVGSNRIVTGKDAYVNHMKQVYSELPDWSFEITHIVGNQRTVIVEFDGTGHFSGTHNAQHYQQVPLKLRAICVFELEHRLIANIREYFDYKGCEDQLLKGKEK